MRLRFSHISWMLVLAAVLLGLVSCIADDESCPAVDAGDGYTVNLTISAGSLGTRTSGHYDAASTDDESFINIPKGDYAVFILDEDDNFVQRFEPGAVSLKREDNNRYSYQISGAFQPERKLEEVRFMVLANWATDFGGSYNAFERILADHYKSHLAYSENDETSNSYAGLTTLEYVYRAGEEIFNFILPTGSVTADGSVSWVPEDGTKGIPMFGLSAQVSLSNLGDNMLIDLTNEIPMLRALAKIEIVNETETENKVTLISAKLTKYNIQGRFVPYVFEKSTTYPNGVNDEWNKLDETTGQYTPQVTTPSLPSANQSGTDLPFVRFEDEDGTEHLTVYVPEMDLSELTDDDRPSLELVLAVNGVEQAPYQIFLANYKDGQPASKDNSNEIDYYDALLRNHWYQFNIRKVEVGVSAELTLLIDTPDWTPDDDEYWYEDTKAEYADNERFTWDWTEGNKDSQESILAGQEENRRTVVVSKEDGIEGIATFTFKEPARGSWTLSISPDDGTPNHWFRIDLWDEENSQWIVEDQIEDADNLIAASLTGKIAKKGETPQQVKVRIVAQDLQYTGAPYTARLLMNVTTFDGRMTEVNLTTADPNMEIGNNGHYIIKQYPTSKE